MAPIRVCFDNSIIVASADAANCQYLLTSDAGMEKLNGKYGLKPEIGPYSNGLPDPDQPLLEGLDDND